MTRSRCEQRRRIVADWMEDHPSGFELDASCEVFAALHGHRDFTDGEILMALVVRGWVEPRLRERRKRVKPSFGVVGGNTARTSHHIAAALAFMVELGDRAGVDQALAEGREALCLAATALWVHGELGPENQLHLWLHEDCPTRLPEAWIHEALAHPMGALDGLALGLLASGPAGAASLDRFGWGPLGLIPAWATPASMVSTDAVDDPVDVTLQWFQDGAWTQPQRRRRVDFVDPTAR